MTCLTRRRSSGIRTRSSAGCVTSSSNKTAQCPSSTWYMNELWKSYLAGRGNVSPNPGPGQRGAMHSFVFAPKYTPLGPQGQNKNTMLKVHGKYCSVPD
jgi:hypothetical protein